MYFRGVNPPIGFGRRRSGPTRIEGSFHTSSKPYRPTSPHGAAGLIISGGQKKHVSIKNEETGGRRDEMDARRVEKDTTRKNVSSTGSRIVLSKHRSTPTRSSKKKTTTGKARFSATSVAGLIFLGSGDKNRRRDEPPQGPPSLPFATTKKTEPVRDIVVNTGGGRNSKSQSTAVNDIAVEKNIPGPTNGTTSEETSHTVSTLTSHSTVGDSTDGSSMSSSCSSTDDSSSMLSDRTGRFTENESVINRRGTILSGMPFVGDLFSMYNHKSESFEQPVASGSFEQPVASDSGSFASSMPPLEEITVVEDGDNPTAVENHASALPMANNSPDQQDDLLAFASCNTKTVESNGPEFELKGSPMNTISMGTLPCSGAPQGRLDDTMLDNLKVTLGVPLGTVETRSNTDCLEGPCEFIAKYVSKIKQQKRGKGSSADFAAKSLGTLVFL